MLYRSYLGPTVALSLLDTVTNIATAKRNAKVHSGGELKSGPSAYTTVVVPTPETGAVMASANHSQPETVVRLSPQPCLRLSKIILQNHRPIVGEVITISSCLFYFS